jgi:hypothetical protein
MEEETWGNRGNPEETLGRGGLYKQEERKWKGGGEPHTSQKENS